jgi:hypothetical protein
MINSEDDPDGPADRRDAVYNYEAVFPRSRLQSMCKLPFAKRRHTIHIPQDYKLVPVRHSMLSFLVFPFFFFNLVGEAFPR